MSVLPVGFGGGRGYQIANSLRFRASASAYLNRTFGTPTSSTIWTWSGWVKRGALTGTYRLFGASTTTYLTFNSSDQLNLTLNGASAATSTAVFRDPSAHYHVVYQQNGSAQTIYVNNTSVATGTTAAAVFNTAIAHQLGAANTSNYFDGYLSEVNFIDGQALTPTSFGQTNADGVWVPNKYTGTYGNNGFYLKFDDGSSATTLCYDRSGNGNNWTPNNISTTAGVTYDWMVDTPTNNYCTLSPIDSGSALTAGNLDFSISSALRTIRSTQWLPTSGKWYWEVYVTTVGNQTAIGIADANVALSSYPYATAGGYSYISSTGNKGNNGGASAYGATFTSTDLIGVTFDADSGTLEFYKNNTSQGTAWTGLSGTFSPAVGSGSSSSTEAASVNFGQRPFTYTPPTGFKALCTANLPAGTVTTSGSFTGNAAAIGPFVWLNGSPTAMTINGNAVTFGTHADKTAGGFKLRTSSASYNAAGTNNYVISTNAGVFNLPQTAKGNP